MCGFTQKKQEFGPSYIAIPTKLCPKEELAIQKNSILEKMIPRIEQKLEVNKHRYLDLLKWINNYGGKVLYPERTICSRYFDNNNMQMYFDTVEGSYSRKK